MRLSVIIPTWKRAQKLEQCLRSLEAQSASPDEVIIVSRIEDEETQAFLARWSSSTSLKTKLIHVQLPGVIHAENKAIAYLLKEAHSEIVTFMDDDARALPGWIADIKKFFALHPEAAALGGPDIILSEPESYHQYPVETVGKITPYGKVIGNHHRRSRGLREVDVLKGVNMSVRRPYLSLLDERLQGENPSEGNGVFWELDLCLSIKGRQGKIFFDPDLLIEHDSNHAHFIKLPVVASTSHNLVFVMLKHLGLGRTSIFLVYSFIIGNGHIRGLVKTAVDLLRRPGLETIKTFQYSLRGFFSGLRLSFLVRNFNSKLR